MEVLVFLQTTPQPVLPAVLPARLLATPRSWGQNPQHHPWILSLSHHSPPTPLASSFLKCLESDHFFVCHCPTPWSRPLHLSRVMTISWWLQIPPSSPYSLLSVLQPEWCVTTEVYGFLKPTVDTGFSGSKTKVLTVAHRALDPRVPSSCSLPCSLRSRLAHLFSQTLMCLSSSPPTSLCSNICLSTNCNASQHPLSPFFDYVYQDTYHLLIPYVSQPFHFAWSHP